jgi:hypothetical protein
MNTAINASHIEREPVLVQQTVVAAGGSAGNGRLFQEIPRRLPGRGLSSLDVATLTKPLREAERIMTNTDLLLQSTTGRPTRRQHSHASARQDVRRGSHRRQAPHWGHTDHPMK